MINFNLRRNHLLSQALRIVDVCQDTERAAPSHELLWDAFEVLSQDDILRIIAKLASEQIEPANIRGIVLDADSHRNGFAGFQRQVIKCHFGYLNAIDIAPGVRHSPDLQQTVL